MIEVSVVINIILIVMVIVLGRLVTNKTDKLVAKEEQIEKLVDDYDTIISGGSPYKIGESYLIKTYISPRQRQVNIYFKFTHTQQFKIVIEEKQSDGEYVPLKVVRGFDTIEECQQFADKYTHEEDYRDAYEKGKQSILKKLKS